MSREDEAGKFRFRLKAGNGEIVTVGEAYNTMTCAKRNPQWTSPTYRGKTVDVSAYP